ncbi:proline/glycine betaine ABC transporter ATP-binding protein ProV [Ochrobactrum sp. POC9]|uniref:glycine betaine/L-proline ABC transporter ATP-binding protein ProV n=1 Tax=unclassified Ochrobactrum TaxID=239106 RepID=UPI000D707DC1|nr:glycine betaine/L-proline ABC transporter ATP-binding protein ProV [Ochrobactrum sp. POC9]MCH4542594.1 glycine betaine/L-proline ABC transporter ATP-binding protein ProV [Ochrobactrum sp. A-1]PWU76268.1 proline/glycine betaine ABC transporter ATP-binding protein ProV [Ochrobactrum sp. POC9]
MKSPAETKISLKSVFKVFGDDPERAMQELRAGKSKTQIHSELGATIGVDDATFDIYEGEVFVIMGLSGSGKSTLLRLLNRLIEPTSGSIEVDGRDIVKMTKRELIDLRRRDMSMVFQSFALLPNRSVLNNASFGLEVAGMGEAERHQKALKALAAVGLEPYANSMPDQLSGGMKQRVGLARALASEPTILLMDEAFSALDPLIRTEMQDELKRLQAEHSRTIIFVSHDLDEAMRIGDRICIMQHGKVVQVGTPNEIVSAPANDYVRSFFRNVDVSRVFKAADVAREDELIVFEPEQLATALERFDASGKTFGVLIDADRTYRGMVSRDALAKGIAVQGGERLDNVSAIEAEAPLSGLLTQVAESPWPVPVTDRQNRYVGAISKSALLETLGRAG